jgi:hypothetical protein
MRIPTILLALALIACRDAPPPVAQKAQPSPPRPPVALLGTWLRTPSLGARHDTLVLRPDSTATGWMLRHPDSDTVVAVARWKVAFLSRDPATARADIPGHYQDGGDPGCTFHSDSTCVSAPVFCLGPVGDLACHGMTYRPDTLWLSNDGRYVRIARSGDSAR